MITTGPRKPLLGSTTGERCRLARSPRHLWLLTIALAANPVILAGQEASGSSGAMQTVAAGLRARELALRDLRGMALHRVFRNPAEVQYWQDLPGVLEAHLPGVPKGRVETPPLDPAIPDRSLLVCQFVLAEGCLRYDVTTYVPGPNDWGAEGVTPQSQGPQDAWMLRPATTIVLNGSVGKRYSQAQSLGLVLPQGLFLPAASQPPLSDLLLLGDSSGLWGVRLAFAVGLGAQLTVPPSAPVELGTAVRLPFLSDAGTWQQRAAAGWATEAQYLGSGTGYGQTVQRIALLDRHPQRGSRSAQLTVVPEWGHAVVSCTRRYYDADGKLLFVAHNEGSNYKAVDGLWLPQRVRRRRQWTSQDPACAVVDDVTFSELRVNVGASAETFAYDFPIGTQYLQDGMVRYLGPVDDTTLRRFALEAPGWDEWPDAVEMRP